MNKPNQDLVDICLAAYVDEICPICIHKFESVEDIKERETVWYPTHLGRIACKKCYEEML